MPTARKSQIANRKLPRRISVDFRPVFATLPPCMNPVIKLLLEGGSLSTAQMAQVLNLSEAEVNRQLDQLKKDRILLGWRPVLNLARGGRRHRPRRHRGAHHARTRRRLQPPGRAHQPLRRGRVVLSHVRRLRPAGVRERRRACRRWRRSCRKSFPRIEGVLSTATHFLLRSYKEQGFLMDVKAEENDRLKVTP